METTKPSFSEYYKYYLTLHRKPLTRLFHALGQFVTILYVYLCVVEHMWFWLWLAPFVVYPFAWFSHFLIEKNEPAAWSRPIMAKVCDWVMLFETLTFRLPIWKKL